MDLYVIMCLCILATSKVMLQGWFAKKSIKTFVDAIFFNGIIFFFASLVFLRNALSDNYIVFLFGAVFGVLTMLFQLCYIKAMTCGNVSLTVLIVNLSMIIPVAASVLVFGDRLTIPKVLGFFLMVVTLFISIDKKEKSKNSRKWAFMSAMAFLLNGGLALTQQTFGKTAYKAETSAFVAYSYIVAAILSFVLYLLLKFKGNNTTYKIRAYIFGIGLCIGIILGAFQYLNTKAIAAIDGLLLFPVYNGGTLILSSFFSVVFLKDKLKINQIISIITGIFAIIIINL